jgi:cobalamin synthase
MIFWLALWSWVMWDSFFWETCYQYVFSPLARWIWPPVYGLIAGGIALFLWWLARRLPGNPILNFLLLGGLDSFPGHLWAMYGRKLMETPLLKDVSIASALTFGYFEFVFYWCVILAIACLFGWLLERKPKLVRPT